MREYAIPTALLDPLLEEREKEIRWDIGLLEDATGRFASVNDSDILKDWPDSIAQLKEQFEHKDVEDGGRVILLGLEWTRRQETLKVSEGGAEGPPRRCLQSIQHPLKQTVVAPAFWMSTQFSDHTGPGCFSC